MPFRLILLTLAMVRLGSPALLKAAEINAADALFFETTIRPLLVERCFECHSARLGREEGGLALDSFAALTRGGQSGPAVISGEVAKSPLLTTLQSSPTPPPKVPAHVVNSTVLGNLTAWAGRGAPWPESPLPVATTAEEISALRKKAERHWAFRPPQQPTLPQVKNSEWPRDRADYFILERLQANGLAPSPDADRTVWLRRVSFDVIGLPPTVSELDDFLADPDPDDEACARVVDRLLGSESFGVRWGRHWLDLARFGESTGYDRNMTYPLAWRYRNYVIEAHNHDVPYDRFIREQLAGDLLPADTPEERDRLAVATGFLVVGPKTQNESNLLLYRMNAIDDQIDATCRAFLGLTANCARCHDHKYDPIPTRDYHALAGIFRSTRQFSGAQTNVRDEDGAAWPLGPDATERLRRLAEHAAGAAEAQQTYLAKVKIRNDIREALEQEGKDWKKSPTPELQDAENEVQRHQGLVKAANENPPVAPDWAMAVSDAAEMINCPVFEKGEISQPREVVPRGVPTLLGLETTRIPADQSGRRQLADWIASPRNALTARVAVNRVWQHLFGTGLVASSDNFGLTGTPPSHPELLDDLALRFTQEGWSLKSLLRSLLLSRTYRQSSSSNPEGEQRDPANRWLWRQPPRLLEAEVLRDSLLAVSGELDPAPQQGSQVTDISEKQSNPQQREIGRRDFLVKDITGDTRYRSVYLPSARSAQLDAVMLFDAADPNLVISQRKSGVVPAQAMYLMNSDFVWQQARLTALKLLAMEPAEDDARLRKAYRIILGRKPTGREEALFLAYLSGNTNTPEASLISWSSLVQALFCTGEFRTAY